MSDAAASDRGRGFKAQGPVQTQYTQHALREHNGPQKDRGVNSPRCLWTRQPSARRDLAFTHDGSLCAVPRDVLGRRSSVFPTTTMYEDQHHAWLTANPRSAVSSRISLTNCPGVSYGVLPPGRTPTRGVSASTAGLCGVSWASSPQTGYKRVSVCAGICIHRIVESNPRTPGTPPACPTESCSTRPETAESVSSPGAGHRRTPQDKIRPGCPSPNPETGYGWSA